LNAFATEKDIRSVTEYGCGDGHQLSLANYVEYVGIDISPAAIQRCVDIFVDDSSKSFFCCDTSAMSLNSGRFDSELTLSLNVIYHLTEDDAYHNYMAHLFDSATRFVIVYASNWDAEEAAHVRHRHFTAWVAAHASEWTLVTSADPPFPHDPSDPEHTSWASFFVFEKASAVKTSTNASTLASLEF